MVSRIALFYVAAVATSAYALGRGGAPERWIAIMLLTAALVTTLIPYDPAHNFSHVVVPLLIVDVLLFIGVTGVAMVADRYWPMYFAAVHGLTVAMHGVRALDATIIPAVYARLGGELAYPTLFFVAFGTWRHRRRAPEADWLWQVRHEQGGAPRSR